MRLSLLEVSILSGSLLSEKQILVEAPEVTSVLTDEFTISDENLIY